MSEQLPELVDLIALPDLPKMKVQSKNGASGSIKGNVFFQLALSSLFQSAHVLTTVCRLVLTKSTV